VEQTIIRNLGIVIKQEFESSDEENFFDLVDVVKYRRAQCLSYAMLVYILGTSLGFSVLPLGVTEIVVPGKLPVGAGHNACLFELANDCMMMVDLGVGPILSEPFDLEETYSKTGRYWELKDDKNPLLLDRRFTIEDKNWLLACVYVNMGKISKPEEAIEYYDRALELSPGYADAYSNKGFACEELGRLNEAISYYNKSLEINPKDARTYYNRGYVRMKLGKYDKAVLDYDLAIANHNNFPEAHFNKGIIYSRLGGHEDAIFSYNSAIELNPQYARAYFHRGMTFSSLNLPIEAILDFTRVIEITPDFAEAYYNRGLGYISSGDTLKAMEDFSRAKTLAPELEEVIEKSLEDINHQ
jgi:tetratricopeptide (TPR) repeat protein